MYLSTLINRMKKLTNLLVKAFILTAVCVNSSIAQSDTLHLDFKPTQTSPDAAMEDMIVKWGKTLKGERVDVNIVAYYHKSDFKKYADIRLDEIFLSLNRKVRELITIKSQDSKKGKDYQRTRVDIIYNRPNSASGVVSTEKGKPAEKAVKDKKSESNSGSASKADNQSYSKSDTIWINGVPTVEKKKTEKSKNQVDIPDDQFRYDTIWVNGKPKIEKRKK